MTQMRSKLRAAVEQMMILKIEDRDHTRGREMKLKLHAAWSQRLKLRAEGDKLQAEGNKLWAEGDKLQAEGNKLWAEGDKLQAEGDKLWADAILAAYGNITLSWTRETEHGECTLENGDRYAEDQSKEADAA